MKVVKLGAFSGITADNTIVTADNNTITVDITTGVIQHPLEIVLVPRVFVNVSDVLNLYLRCELTDYEYNVTTEWNYNNMYLYVRFPFDTIPNVSGNKYEIMLTVGSSIIYMGKLITIDTNQSTQDYKNTIITNKKLKF